MRAVAYRDRAFFLTTRGLVCKVCGCHAERSNIRPAVGVRLLCVRRATRAQTASVPASTPRDDEVCP